MQVEQNACEACCDSFPPTLEDWNPTIASLLHRLADKVLDAGGVDGCTIEEAAQLAAAAIEQLPVVVPDQDDGNDDIQTFVPPAGTSLDDLLRCVPPPLDSRTCQPATWAVGVTTAPRRQPTLSPCLQTLMSSGWVRPHLFVDGPGRIGEELEHLPRTERPASIGAWPAWCEALRTLLDEYPDSEIIGIFQDDALFPATPVLRRYIDRCLWPKSGPYLLSLYTSTDDMQQENGWRRYPTVWKYGAVAFVLPRQVARRLRESIDRGDLDFLPGTAGIDTRIGIWADRCHVPIWHPSPSLVQHIGQVSSVWRHSRAVGLRRANRFIADELRRQSGDGNDRKSR